MTGGQVADCGPAAQLASAPAEQATGIAPLVTVLIPARNEATDITECIAAIGRQTYPLDRIQLVVVDGDSDDGTAAVARRAAAQLPLASALVLHNPGGSTPDNLNAGLAAAVGTYVCRVDARSRVAPHHVATCVTTLASRPDVIVVGGAQVAVPRSDQAASRGLARALNNRLTMGGARYRRGANSGPTDTVYLGAFRRTDLERAGGWNPAFATNQDFELNRRLGRRGVVWFDQTIPTGYIPRASVGLLFQQYRRFGRWKVRYWRSTGNRPERRQAALLAAPLAGIVGAVAVGRSHPRLVAVAAAVALVAVDALGSTDEPLDVAERAHAIRAMLATSGGWTVGVWEELLRGGSDA